MSETTKGEKKKDLSEIMDSLEQGVEDLFTSERYTACSLYCIRN